MSIVGFGYSKISVEKKEKFKIGTEVSNNVKITNVKESSFMMGKGESPSIIVDFEFNVDYGSAGYIELLGHVLIIESSETIKKAVESWDKDKRMPTEIGQQIYNYLLVKCNVKVLQLEEDIGLPLHIKMPTVSVKK